MCEAWERESDRDQGNRVWEKGRYGEVGKWEQNKVRKHSGSASCHSNYPTICACCAKQPFPRCILSDGRAVISKADNGNTKRQENKRCLGRLCICPARLSWLHSRSRMGVLLYIQKKKKRLFCWHQAQAWLEELNGWMTRTVIYSFQNCTNRCVHQTTFCYVAWMNKCWTHPLARNAPASTKSLRR